MSKSLPPTFQAQHPPSRAEAAAREICGWVVDTLGEAGAKSEVWMAD